MFVVRTVVGRLGRDTSLAAAVTYLEEGELLLDIVRQLIPERIEGGTARRYAPVPSSAVNLFGGRYDEDRAFDMVDECDAMVDKLGPDVLLLGQMIEEAIVKADQLAYPGETECPEGESVVGLFCYEIPGVSREFDLDGAWK